MNNQIEFYEIQYDGKCKGKFTLPQFHLENKCFSLTTASNTHFDISHIDLKDSNEYAKEIQALIAEEYMNHSNVLIAKQEFQNSSLKAFYTYFHDVQIHLSYELSIHILATDQFIKVFFIQNNDQIKILNQDVLKGVEISYDQLTTMIHESFTNAKEVFDEFNTVSVQVGKCIKIYDAKVDFRLPKDKIVWKNFRISRNIGYSIDIFRPSTFKGKWQNYNYPYDTVLNLLRERFRLFILVNYEKQSSKTKQTKVNELGRVYDALNKPFEFMPHSVLKLVDPSSNLDRKKDRGDGRVSINAVVRKMITPNGGIGSFEIEIIEWISLFKYCTKSMILDLVLSGYISLGKRESISADKMTNIMNRLYDYDLVELSNFIQVDDEGNQEGESKGIYRVFTLGTTGYNLLRQLERRPGPRNALSILLDGDTIKKHLSASQFVIYWLAHYPKDKILNYGVNQTLHIVGPSFNGARFYANVNFNYFSIVGEPARRCEDFEIENNIHDIQFKLERMIDVFDHIDHLYNSAGEKVNYNVRPTICLICEDDEHMDEVFGWLKELIINHPQQVVWFTTDTRMFNYNCKNKRFLQYNENGLQVVDLTSVLGIEEMSMEELGGFSNDYIENSNEESE